LGTRLPGRGRRLRREQLPERPSGQIELCGRGRHVWRRSARALAAAPARPQVLEQWLHALQLQLRAPARARVSGLSARGQSGAAARTPRWRRGGASTTLPALAPAPCYEGSAHACSCCSAAPCAPHRLQSDTVTRRRCAGVCVLRTNANHQGVVANTCQWQSYMNGTCERAPDSHATRLLQLPRR